MSTKTASKLFDELKTEVEGGRCPAVTSVLLNEMMEVLGMTSTQFARVTDIPWITVHRWLGNDSRHLHCPRAKFLSRIEALVNKEVMPLNTIKDLAIYPETRLIARLSSTPKRSWTFMAHQINDQRLTDELFPSVNTERYYVYPVDAACHFRSFRRKVERGGLSEIAFDIGLLQGKIIGLAVDANDYPLFVKGLTVYVLEFEEDDVTHLEGYMVVPVMQRSGVSPVIVRIDEQLVRKWHEDCQLLAAWYEAHKAEANKIEEFEVRYA